MTAQAQTFTAGSATPRNVDFASLIETVAKELCGHRKQSSATPNEIRYGSKGSLSVNLRDGTWYCHEEKTGGGVLDLIRHFTNEDPWDYLRQKNLVEDEQPKFASVGKPKAVTAQQDQTYVYTDTAGNPIYRARRYYSQGSRKFAQERFKDGQWATGVKGIEPLPYNLKHLADNPDATVVIVEGEKDADNLMAAGILSTCNSGGAGAWKPCLNQYLKGRDIIVLPDNDNPGRDHAQKVVLEVAEVAKTLRILDIANHWPDAPAKADVSDFMAAGGDVQNLMALAAEQLDLMATRSDTPTEPPEPLPDAKSGLMPDFPPLLVNLPNGLGAIQDYIYGRQIYPSRVTAGMAALAVVTSLAQRRVTVNALGELGLNEYYMILAPTGSGKDSTRTPLRDIKQALEDLQIMTPSALKWAAPASPQGLHKLLEEDNALMFVADEFAEWLRMTSGDPSKQATLGYFMQCYSSANNEVAPGHAVKEQYTPVKNPRVSIFATSTAEAMLESMTLQHADSGAYNRWVMFCAEQERIPKRYEGLRTAIPDDVMSIAKWIGNLKPLKMSFTKSGWETFKDIDANEAEPLKFSDPHLAGRLGEQAIKMAALIALSDQRMEITGDDMSQGFLIRLGLYKRASAMAKYNGAFSGLHATGQALEQVEKALAKKPVVYKSQLPKVSRKYAALSLPERNAVLSALLDSGAAEEVKGSKATLKSNLYMGAA